MTTKRQDFCNDHKIHHVHCSLIKANNGQKIDHIWTKALFKNIMNYNKKYFPQSYQRGVLFAKHLKLFHLVHLEMCGTKKE